MNPDRQLAWMLMCVVFVVLSALDRNWLAFAGWVFACSCELQLCWLLAKLEKGEDR